METLNNYGVLYVCMSPKVKGYTRKKKGGKRKVSKVSGYVRRKPKSKK